jgi:hypothetical protein
MGRLPRLGSSSSSSHPQVVQLWRPGTAPEGPHDNGRARLGLHDAHRPITAPMLETGSSFSFQGSSCGFPSAPHTPYTNLSGSVGMYPSSMLERQAVREESRLRLGSARTFRNRDAQKRLPPSKIRDAVDRLTRYGAPWRG